MTEKLIHKLNFFIAEKERTVLFIDGKAASGKTTLAGRLEMLFDAAVIHMDDFFLPFEMKTTERLKLPGGNIHSERFYDEVVLPLTLKELPIFRRYNCATGLLSGFVEIPPKRLIIIEGVYSMLPEFRGISDLSVFMETTETTQLKRLSDRDHSKLRNYTQEWLPMENIYFRHFKIKDICDIVIKT